MLPELNYRQKADMFAQLATMESAGLSFDKALSLLERQPALTKRVANTRRLLRQGLDLAQACGKSELMSKFETGLLQAAISAGSPAALFKRLADFYNHKNLLLQRVKSRMLLPGLMMVMAVVLSPLPALVGGQLSIAGYLFKTLSSLGILGGLVYAGFSLPGWLATGPLHGCKSAVDQLLIQVPLFGAMHVRAQARDFFESLALMLEAGLPLLDAMPKALDAITNSTVRQWCKPVDAGLRDKQTFTQAIRSLPQDWVERVEPYVSSGEASGHLPEMLFRLCRTETEALTLFYQQVADWLPRVFYAIAAFMALTMILSSGVFMPKAL